MSSDSRFLIRLRVQSKAEARVDGGPGVAVALAQDQAAAPGLANIDVTEVGTTI